MPIREGLPLADKPHLLNPTARRDQLFGSARNSGDNLHIETPEYIGYGAQATGKSFVWFQAIRGHTINAMFSSLKFEVFFCDSLEISRHCRMTN